MTEDQHSLLSDLERATSGTFELDRRIAEAVGHMFGGRFPPAYTVSIDAALTLADPDWWLQLRHQRSGEGEKWCVCFFELTEDPYIASARAKTFPLAVTAAALRARWS